MSITFEVSKFVKSNEINDEQQANILFIIVTLEVLKLDKFKEVKELQIANISYIDVT